MSKFLSLALIAFASIASARADVTFPDQIYTVARCRNTSGLVSGLSAVVSEGGLAGLTTVALTNRDGLGPYVNLGSFNVTAKTDNHGSITYKSADVTLDLYTDEEVGQGDVKAHIYADVNGRVFNEDMICTLYAHAL